MRRKIRIFVCSARSAWRGEQGVMR